MWSSRGHLNPNNGVSIDDASLTSVLGTMDIPSGVCPVKSSVETIDMFASTVYVSRDRLVPVW